MATALRYRLFGMGKMAPELREVASGPGVLVSAEGVSVRQTVDQLKIPRASVNHGTKLVVGAIVLLEARLMLSVGKRVWLDTALHTAGDEGSALTFRTDGIMIALEVARLVKGGSGRVNMRYRHALSDDVLAMLPGTSCDLPPAALSPRLLDGWKGTWSL